MLYVTGRSISYHQYIGCVSQTEDKSDRRDDIVQSIPCRSPSQAIERGRELRTMLLAQAAGCKLACNGRFI